MYQKVSIEKVIKRDGRVVDFDANRISEAVRKAMASTNQYNAKTHSEVLNYVLKVLSEKFSDGRVPHVEEIQDIVELSLVKFDLYEVAKAYILYRKERERIREEKKKILEKDYVDEVDKAFSLNALRLMASRYLLRDENGKLIEWPRQMFQRVAALVAIPDVLYNELVFSKAGGQKIHEKEGFNPLERVGKLGLEKEGDGYKVVWNEWHLERMKHLYDELNSQGKMKVSWSEFLNLFQNGVFKHNFENYYNIMVSKKFIPNSPTLFNAGTKLGQLSACFVLDIEDDIESIMNAAKDAALIFKSGGGVGINYSKLRPEGDIVFSTSGVASGPVSFMKIIDTVTEVVKQGGKRRGANMGILEIWHPDIEKFINSKLTEGYLENFNISVLITPDFWECYEFKKPYPLINPRSRTVWKTVDPVRLFRLIAETAWKTADPGVIFLDNLNRRSPLKKSMGYIRATNPCGEQPLYPYESCNLGSINLYAFIRHDANGPVFDWEELSKIVRLAVRFLDNVIDVNRYPLQSIEEKTKRTRRIGLGVMGLADTLYALKIPYNSEEGFVTMSKIMEFIAFHAMLESVELAKERGAFPEFQNSSYMSGELPIEGYHHKEWWTLNWEEVVSAIKNHGIRNSHVTTVAPTGSISMLVDVSSGLEPQFALVFEKRVTVGTFYYCDAEFERQLKDAGLHNDALLKKVAENGGSVQGLDDIPEDLKKVFLVAYDMPWWDHVRAQFEVGKWVDASVSKTINMPSWVSPDDVMMAYLFAYKLGLKGITVYRDSSKTAQVLVTPTHRMEKYLVLTSNNTLKIMEKLGFKVEQILARHIKANAVFEKVEVKPKPTHVVVASEKTTSMKEKVEKCPACSSLNMLYQETCVKCIDCGWSSCPIA